MAEPEIGEVLKDITADVQTIISGEVEQANVADQWSVRVRSEWQPRVFGQLLIGSRR